MERSLRELSLCDFNGSMLLGLLCLDFIRLLVIDLFECCLKLFKSCLLGVISRLINFWIPKRIYIWKVLWWRSNVLIRAQGSWWIHCLEGLKSHLVTQSILLIKHTSLSIFLCIINREISVHSLREGSLAGQSVFLLKLALPDIAHSNFLSLCFVICDIFRRIVHVYLGFIYFTRESNSSTSHWAHAFYRARLGVLAKSDSMWLISSGIQLVLKGLFIMIHLNYYKIIIILNGQLLLHF